METKLQNKHPKIQTTAQVLNRILRLRLIYPTASQYAETDKQILTNSFNKMDETRCAGYLKHYTDEFAVLLHEYDDFKHLLYRYEATSKFYLNKIKGKPIYEGSIDFFHALFLQLYQGELARGTKIHKDNCTEYHIEQPNYWLKYESMYQKYVQANQVEPLDVGILFLLSFGMFPTFDEKRGDIQDSEQQWQKIKEVFNQLVEKAEPAPEVSNYIKRFVYEASEDSNLSDCRLMMLCQLNTLLKHLYGNGNVETLFQSMEKSFIRLRFLPLYTTKQHVTHDYWVIRCFDVQLNLYHFIHAVFDVRQKTYSEQVYIVSFYYNSQYNCVVVPLSNETPGNETVERPVSFNGSFRFLENKETFCIEKLEIEGEAASILSGATCTHGATEEMHQITFSAVAPDSQLRKQLEQYLELFQPVASQEEAISQKTFQLPLEVIVAKRKIALRYKDIERQIVRLNNQDQEEIPGIKQVTPDTIALLRVELEGHQKKFYIVFPTLGITLSYDYLREHALIWRVRPSNKKLRKQIDDYKIKILELNQRIAELTSSRQEAGFDTSQEMSPE